MSTSHKVMTVIFVVLPSKCCYGDFSVIPWIYGRVGFGEHEADLLLKYCAKGMKSLRKWLEFCRGANNPGVTLNINRFKCSHRTWHFQNLYAPHDKTHQQSILTSSVLSFLSFCLVPEAQGGHKANGHTMVMENRYGADDASQDFATNLSWHCCSLSLLSLLYFTLVTCCCGEWEWSSFSFCLRT